MLGYFLKQKLAAPMIMFHAFSWCVRIGECVAWLCFLHKAVWSACCTAPILQHPGPSDAYDDRRKSHGGDSKYGFASGGYHGSDPYSSRPPVNANSTGGGGGGIGSMPGSPYSSVPPPGYSGRPPQQSLPPPTHSPHQRRSPSAHPSRGPPQMGYSPLGPGGQMAPPPPYLNGHSGEGGPEVPPKVDRTSKPGRVRSGQDFGSGKDLDYDANYMNTGRGNSLERQHKVSTPAVALHCMLDSVGYLSLSFCIFPPNPFPSNHCKSFFFSCWDHPLCM